MQARTKVASNSNIRAKRAMAVTREEIVEFIRQLAKTEGKPPGRRSFEQRTGISYTDWFGRYWTKWGDALQEAGFSANERNESLEKEDVVDAYLNLIAELGRIPTEGDLRMKKRSDDGFPSHGAIRKHLGNRRERLTAALENSPNSAAERLLLEAIATLPPEKGADAEVIERLDPLPTGYVYMVKSGKYYKIGKTNSIDRRQYEIGLQLAEGLKPIHSIETDDPSGIEAYWHNRFKEKRMNGEWFNLDARDVRAFRLRKKFM